MPKPLNGILPRRRLDQHCCATDSRTSNGACQQHDSCVQQRRRTNCPHATRCTRGWRSRDQGARGRWGLLDARRPRRQSQKSENGCRHETAVDNAARGPGTTQRGRGAAADCHQDVPPTRRHVRRHAPTTYLDAPCVGLPFLRTLAPPGVDELLLLLLKLVVQRPRVIRARTPFAHVVLVYLCVRLVCARVRAWVSVCVRVRACVRGTSESAARMRSRASARAVFAGSISS